MTISRVLWISVAVLAILLIGAGILSAAAPPPTEIDPLRGVPDAELHRWADMAGILGVLVMVMVTAFAPVLFWLLRRAVRLMRNRRRAREKTQLDAEEEEARERAEMLQAIADGDNAVRLELARMRQDFEEGTTEMHAAFLEKLEEHRREAKGDIADARADVVDVKDHCIRTEQKIDSLCQILLQRGFQPPVQGGGTLALPPPWDGKTERRQRARE